VENRAADIIQTYAAKMTLGEVTADGETLDADEIAEAEAAADDAALAAAEKEGEGDGGLTEEYVEAKIMAKVAQEKKEADNKPFISPASLGPSKPTGKLKESLTMSTLVSAMSVTTASTTGEGVGGVGTPGGTRSGRGLTTPAGLGGLYGGEEEEEDNERSPVSSAPLPLEELKKLALQDVMADKTVKAIGKAAAVAAYVLGTSSVSA